MKNILTIRLLFLSSVFFILSNCGIPCNHENMEEYISECAIAEADGQMRNLFYDGTGNGFSGTNESGCYYMVDDWEKLVDLCNPDFERVYVADSLCTSCKTYGEIFGG